jgi:hypothetical protein
VLGEKEEGDSGGRGGISRENVATQHASRPMAPCDRREERFKGKEVERTSGIVVGGMRLRLFAARLDPERRLVVVAVLSHVVQHQLRLTRLPNPQTTSVLVLLSAAL